MHTKEHNTQNVLPLPKTFAGVMEMYEKNYMRLRLLCGDIRSLPDYSFSHIEGGVPVSLKVIDRAAHTTTILLTYLFRGDETEFESKPDMIIRISHDAKQAEVVSRQCRITGQRIRAWDSDEDNVLLCRWRLNRFLYKWLGYLYRQKHDFKS